MAIELAINITSLLINSNTNENCITRLFSENTIFYGQLVESRKLYKSIVGILCNTFTYGFITLLFLKYARM